MVAERTAVFSFKTKDVAIELGAFCSLVVCYSVIAFQHELSKAKTFSTEIANDVIGSISSFIPVAFVIVLTFEIGWYLIMLLWNLHKREIEVRAKDEGRAEGKAESNKSWVEWNTRRLEAEKNNDKFNEPPPSEAKDD